MSDEKTVTIPPALTLLPDGLLFQVPSGTSRFLKAQDFLDDPSPAVPLLWANLLIQKDLAERTAIMAQAMTDLAKALGGLVQRASQPTDINALMRGAMEQARTMLSELKQQPKES